MPSNKEEWKKVVENPIDFLLQTFPSKIQATKVWVIEPSWAKDVKIKAAFERFNASLKNMQSVFDSRNADVELKNRNGAEILPYQLLN
ncbi:Linoleate 13S-lipoxygenase 2-1 chloroplastic [Bienertia sinuspersici]